MAQYGACDQTATAAVLGDDSAVSASAHADTEAPPAQAAIPAPVKPNGANITGGPLFLENPDGTITEAIPFTFGRDSGTSPAAKLLDRLGHFGSVARRGNGDNDSDGGSSGNMSEAAAATMYQEVEFLYSRHERVLMLLLLTQVLLEGLYDSVFVMSIDRSVIKFQEQYNASERGVRVLFWTIFVISVAYGVVYYVIAIMAMCTKRPKVYRLFANWSLVGIVGLVLLAYVNQFNLVVFFLRLLAYIYARFLQGLTASLVLLPPGNGNANQAAAAAAAQGAAAPLLA